MEYRIIEKSAFTVMGKARKFSAETSYRDIPLFWQELMENGKCKNISGMYGICMDGDGSSFDYLIADCYDHCGDIPEGCITKTIPAGTWAVFPCRGELPKALQDVNTRIWNEWLPSCREYKLGGNYNIERYTPPADDPKDTYSEIWVPVIKV